jgi:hypothetical protein
MQFFALTAVVVCIAHAVIGNAIVGLILLHKKIPMRMMWAGTPFYLYGVCNRASPPVGTALRTFALSTNIALILTIPSLVWFSVVSK